MHNLIEYSHIYSKKSENLWQHCSQFMAILTWSNDCFLVAGTIANQVAT